MNSACAEFCASIEEPTPRRASCNSTLSDQQLEQEWRRPQSQNEKSPNFFTQQGIRPKSKQGGDTMKSVFLSLVTLAFTMSAFATPEQKCRAGLEDEAEYNSCVVAVQVCSGILGSQSGPPTPQMISNYDKCEDASLQHFMRQSAERSRAEAALKKKSPTATAGSTTDFNALEKQCVTDTKEAKDFCSDPVSKSTDGGVSNETANVAVQLGMMAGSIANGDKGINGFCNMGATTGASLAGLNGTFAGRCSSYISDCQTSCGAALTEATRLNGNGAFAERLMEISKQNTICERQKTQAAKLTNQASSNAQGAMMSKLCANASKSTTAGVNFAPPVVPVPQGDCTGANATSPLCRTNDGGAGSGGGSGGFDYANGGSSGKESGMNVGDIDFAGTQGGKADPIAGSETKGPGVPNGGGAMLGQGDKGGQGGGDEKGRGGAAAGGNANVLQGERGGGGYSVSQGGAVGSGGGWGGYGGMPSDIEKRDKFDLSKYLPGGKNAPARGPAGLARAGGEIAPPHEDIFKKISNRVQVVCRTNRLMDCN